MSNKLDVTNVRQNVDGKTVPFCFDMIISVAETLVFEDYSWVLGASKHRKCRDEIIAKSVDFRQLNKHNQSIPRLC